MGVLLLLLFAQSLSEEGALAMREKRFSDAERIYRQMVKDMSGDPRIRMNLGLALHSSGKYAQAVPEFQAFLKAYPRPGPVHLMLGVSLLKLRRACEAVPPLETAQKWQASAQVLIELGDAYAGCHRYADAARVFESLGPIPKALQGTGLSYAQLGRQDAAQAAFEKLASLPPSAELHELLAEVRTLEGKHEEAITELDNALKLAPGDSRLQRLRARALWRAGRYDVAAKAYASLAPSWSHDPEFNYERGDTLVRTEGPKAGLPYLQAAVKAAPEIIPARGALGRALAQVGRAAESIPHLEAAAQQDPTLLLPLSRAYKQTGRPEEAARTEAEYRSRVGNQN